MYVDHSSVNSTIAPGNLLNLPVWCYLLETEEGPILVDTGMPESAVNNEGLFNGTFVEGQILPKMTEEDRIVNILKRVGYEPDDLYILLVLTYISIMQEETVLLQIHRLLCNERNMRQHFIEKNI